jgi:hypothetical protein
MSDESKEENRNNTSPSIQGSQTCAMDYRGVIWIFWIVLVGVVVRDSTSS